MPSETYLAESVDEDYFYTYPQSVSHGHKQLIQKMESTQRNFPGARFRNDKGHRSPRAQAISNWKMFDDGGKPIFTGTGYARFGPEGRRTQMTGFFEPNS